MQKTIFQLHLLAAIAFSFARMVLLVAAGFVWRWAPALAILVWVLVALVIVLQPKLRPSFFASSQPATPASASTDLQSQISFWETQLQKQPTDRDILHNLAQLYAAAGNQSKAQQYTTAAQQVDPNFK